MSDFRTIALVGKRDSDDVAASLSLLRDHLHASGRTLVDASAGSDLETCCARADLAIVLGGDGTLLNVARRLAVHEVPVVGINQGRLGFMTDIARADMLPLLDRLLGGEYTVDRRMLLDASVLRDGNEVFCTHALNEVVVNKGDLGRMIEMELRVDGEFLCVLRADGMIVSTPTGSTAYALSANGPILHPAVAGIALVPLCAHALTNRPITIADTSCVEITLVQTYDGRVHCDGQCYFDAKAGDTVRITRSPHAVTLLHPPGYSYFAMLRQKLHWSATPYR